MIKQYTAKEKYNINACGFNFDIEKGSIVEVDQVDSASEQVLVNYGAGFLGWMGAKCFHNLFEEIEAHR